MYIFCHLLWNEQQRIKRCSILNSYQARGKEENFSFAYNKTGVNQGVGDSAK